MELKMENTLKIIYVCFITALGDSKQWIRVAAVTCIEIWCREAGAHTPFDGEMVLDALKAGSPVLRATLLQWLAEHLPNGNFNCLHNSSRRDV